jgi:twitching motility protein PilT
MITLTQTPKTPLRVLERCTIGGTVDPQRAGESVLISIADNPVIAASRVGKDGHWKVDLAFKQPGTQEIKIHIASDSAPLTLPVVGRDGSTTPNPTIEGAAPLSAVAVAPGADPMVHAAIAKPSPESAVSRPHAKLSPGNPTLMQLVRQAYEQDYSDVHVGVGRSPRFRSQGEIITTQHPVTDEASFASWLQEILSEAEIDRFYQSLDYDGAAQYDFVRIRVNLFMSIKGPCLVLRLIPLQPPLLENLGFPEIFRDICFMNQGLVLVTGPTGSGKSTTLAAMVNEINSHMAKHVVTIEDPIEFVHSKDQKSLISQREVGIHTHEFNRALKAALREDPDVILIGEMRDRETLSTAMKAAQTGHLVFGTLHTNSAVKTLERILDLFEPDERDSVRKEMAETLAAVISQSLLPTTDGKRCVISEVLINNDTIRDFIHRDETDEIEAQLKDGAFYGMNTRNQSIFKLFEEGRITEETALEASLKKSEMAIMLRGGIV